jgi:hypothetical protein
MSRTLRSRKGIGAGAMIALCLAALSATAQERPVTTGANRQDTVKLRVSGRVGMDYVQRDSALTTIPTMDPTGNAGGATGSNDSSVNTVEGEVTIRFDAELTEKISAVVEIGRLRSGDNGSSSGILPFSGDNLNNDITLREAHLKVMDFLSPGVSVKMGILDWGFDVRGRGQALAFNPHYSQAMSRHHFIGQDSAAAGGSMATRYGVASATELEPMGLHLSYTGGQLTIELVAMPVVSEFGPASQDEALYAVDFWYNLEQQVGKGSRIGAILALSNLDASGPIGTASGSDTQVVTFGAGANLAFQGGIEVYAEGYFQTGAAGREGVGASQDFDAKGNAFQIGGRWTGSGDGKMWLELNFTMYSGDDDTAADDEVNSFMSYENISDFLIIEDMNFGLDVDTNYTAFKIMGGMSFSMAGGKDNVELALGVGFFTTTEDVTTSVAGEEEDALGTEIDVKLKYHLSKQAALGLNFGVLTGSDLLEEMGGGSGSDTADDSAWLLSLGFDVRY